MWPEEITDIEEVKQVNDKHGHSVHNKRFTWIGKPQKNIFSGPKSTKLRGGGLRS